MSGSRSPRSLLIGWGNARRSQLEAYQRLHASLGLAPEVVIPDTRRGIVSRDAYARGLAPTAAQLVADPHPTLVHLFSDNGFLGWAALLGQLAPSGAGRLARDAIRGVVLDSSPGLWASRGKLDFARRFALGMTPVVARAARLGPRERIPFVTPLLGAAFVGYQLAFPRAVRGMLAAAEQVERDQPRCPHLFLYGDQDVLVPPGDVEAWIRRQRANGLEVEAERFEGARHVALYPCDPRRYRDVLAAFATRVLEGGR